MGSALASGWVRAGLKTSSIHIVEADAARRKALSELGYKTCATLPASLAPAASLLAIKPQGFADFSKELKAWYKAVPQHPVFSILAGIPLKQLQSVFGAKAPVIRTMPNTPALVGEGVTAYIGNKAAEPFSPLALRLFGVVGDVLELRDESLMDAVTAVSGSGPAYAFHFLEAFVAAAVKAGLPKEVAGPLCLQTLYGALALAMDEGTAPAELRKNVTSPGGTTEAALRVLMDTKTGLAPLIHKAVKAAAKRSQQLSNG